MKGQMKDVTKTHWTTFNEMLGIRDILIDRVEYETDVPNRRKHKLFSLMMPWVRGREDDPIPLSVVIQSVGDKKAFELIRVDKHPDTHRAALELGMRILQHGDPTNKLAIDVYEESLNWDSENHPPEEKPLWRHKPYNAVAGAVTSVMKQFSGRPEEWKKEVAWMVREFLILFGAYPADEETMKRIEGWTGKPFRGPLTLNIMYDAFSAVEKNIVMVDTILVSENTRRTLFHVLTGVDEYADMGSNFLWSGHIETGDIPDNKIFIIGESGCDSCVQRVDITE